MTAWRAGWRSFWARPDAILVPVLVATLAWVVVEFFVQAAISGTVTRSRPCERHLGPVTDVTRCAAGADAHWVGATLGFALYVALGLVFWAVLVRAGLAALGKPARMRPLPVAGAALLGGVALTAGIGFGFLPGIVLAFLGQFTMVAIVAEQAGPLTGFVRSVQIVLGAPGTVLGFSALATLTLFAGFALFFVGVFPAVAIVLLGQLHLWSSAEDVARAAT